MYKRLNTYIFVSLLVKLVVSRIIEVDSFRVVSLKYEVLFGKVRTFCLFVLARTFV